jgi:glycosyltransferase involved in cell wall biosynthesis
MAVGAYYPELAGGSLQCRTLVAALRDRVDFSVLTTTIDRTLAAESMVDGVPVHRVFVDARDPLTKIAATGRLLRLAARLGRDADIFHLHGFTEKMLLLVAAARLLGVRTIEKMTSVGWDDPVAIRGRRFGRVLAAGLSAVDRIVAVSPAMVDRCRDADVPDDRVTLIPNGVDTDRFTPVDCAGRAAARARLGLPADVRLVTFVGFWSPEKGPDVLFDAWDRARQRTGVDSALLFIGATDPRHAEVRPELVAAVRARIEARSLRDRVMFVELTTDVASYLQASDIFALPSSREGLSNALLEAMATGLPCVAAAIPGVTDSVMTSGENGCIVPSGDVDAVAAALTTLLENDRVRHALGRRARQTILDRFAIGAVADRYDALYRSLLG